MHANCSQVMSVKGKLIDSISSLHISPCSNPGKTIQQKLATWFLDLSAWRSACEEIVRASKGYKTEAQKEEAPWRTLIFDSTAPYGLRTPDTSYAASYKAYRDLVDLELSIEAISGPPHMQTHTAVQSKRGLYDSQWQASNINGQLHARKTILLNPVRLLRLGAVEF